MQIQNPFALDSLMSFVSGYKEIHQQSKQVQNKSNAR